MALMFSSSSFLNIRDKRRTDKSFPTAVYLHEPAALARLACLRRLVTVVRPRSPPHRNRPRLPASQLGRTLGRKISLRKTRFQAPETFFSLGQLIKIVQLA